MRRPFVRRAVRRFMPGESMDEALDACQDQELKAGTGTILTRLGENVASAAEAEAVTAHYLELLDRIDAANLNAQVSVKLTQLGLDVGAEVCRQNLLTLVRRGREVGIRVWIDMESSGYVDRTIDLYRSVRERSPLTGVCLQAYLRRTPADLEALLPLAAAIRLVKGAYRESPAIAFPRKADVDRQYFELVSRLFQPDVPAGTLLGVGTHDERLVERVQALAATKAPSNVAWEFEMLYGIQRPLQARLTRQGMPLRVLISYGAYWFPWYMRRLAERPANVLFLLKALLAR
jgi:proline dehydrogenase